MKNDLMVECPRCGSHTHVPYTQGNKKDLADRIEFLEKRLFDIEEENKHLRKTLFRL